MVNRYNQQFNTDDAVAIGAALFGGGSQEWYLRNFSNNPTILQKSLPAAGLAALGLGGKLYAPRDIQPIGTGFFHSGLSALGWHLSSKFMPGGGGNGLPGGAQPAPVSRAAQRAPQVQRPLPAPRQRAVAALPPGRPVQQPVQRQVAQPAARPRPAAPPTAQWPGGPPVQQPVQRQQPMMERGLHENVRPGATRGHVPSLTLPAINVTGRNPNTGEQIIFSRV